MIVVGIALCATGISGFAVLAYPHIGEQLAIGLDHVRAISGRARATRRAL
jgi:hypothetical protein